MSLCSPASPLLGSRSSFTLNNFNVMPVAPTNRLVPPAYYSTARGTDVARVGHAGVQLIACSRSPTRAPRLTRC